MNAALPLAGELPWRVVVAPQTADTSEQLFQPAVCQDGLYFICLDKAVMVFCHEEIDFCAAGNSCVDVSLGEYCCVYLRNGGEKKDRIN